MSSRKEDKERKEKATSNPQSQDITPTESVTTATTTTTESSQYADQQQQQQNAVNRALDGTKDSIRRSIDEARSQIPRYTQSVNDYQEQTIQAAREMADNYIESQKEIINSFQSAWVPYAESMYERFYAYCMSPRRMTEAYTRMVSSFADNINSAIRAANNMVFTNMDALKTSIQQARDNARELSRIGVNAAKTFEQTSRDTSRQGTDGGSTRVSFER
jgi:gas vesicle protein